MLCKSSAVVVMFWLVCVLSSWFHSALRRQLCSILHLTNLLTEDISFTSYCYLRHARQHSHYSCLLKTLHQHNITLQCLHLLYWHCTDLTTVTSIKWYISIYVPHDEQMGTKNTNRKEIV